MMVDLAAALSISVKFASFRLLALSLGLLHSFHSLSLIVRGGMCARV